MHSFKSIHFKLSHGFTLIELMITIAIIALIAAIAIPNFIAYRNKAFCSSSENDAINIAAAVADYFAIAFHNNTPTISDLNGGAGYTLSGTNTATISGIDPNVSITISVTDRSGRCPEEYQAKSKFWNGESVYILPLMK